MKQNLQNTFIGTVLLSFSLLLVTIYEANGQAEPIKFGKLEQTALEMKAYDKDTTASAVILCDYGKSYFRFNQNDGFQVYFDRHIRIKILKKSGYEWANAEIPFYRVSNTEEEEVNNLKAYTYNLEGDKIVKEKLTKEAVFEEKVSENWYIKKFTMPAIKEGSVIEYSYTIKSDFIFNFREWEFQHTIPVLWSEYRATFPEYFYYKQLAQGFEPFFIAENKSITETFTAKYDAQITPGMNGSRTSGGTQNFTSASTVYRWVTKDVPAFKNEPFITTINDYITKIEFELARTKLPGQMEKSYTNSWETLTEALIKNENFGLQLSKTGFAKDEVAAFKAKYNDPEQRMAAIYTYVGNHMKWNGSKRKYIETTLKKAYESRTGSSADINLLLTALLREAGLEAKPVILSTRDHGRIISSYTLLSKFNYVIAHVNVNGKEYLMDATDPIIRCGVLPTRCLNGEGRLISSVNPRWIPLTSSEKISTVFSAKLSIDKSGELKGNVDVSEGGYRALSTRKSIQNEGKEKYIEAIKKIKTSWQIEKHDFVDLESIDKALSTKYEVIISDHAQVAGNLIYLKPMLTEGEKENPFKLEQRLFPVDFAAPVDETYICYFTLPEGYHVEELPKNIITDLPEKSGRFTYMAAINGNIIQVMSKIQLKKPVYSAEEYHLLKELYSQIVTKHAEQIVLKKSGI